MKNNRHSIDSDIEAEPHARPQDRKKNYWLKAEGPDFLDISSIETRRAGEQIQGIEVKLSPEGQVVDLSPIEWTAPDQDEYGPLAEELQKLFVDIVDPETGEVTRQPVIPVEDELPTGKNMSEPEAIPPTSPSGQEPEKPTTIESTENQDTGEEDDQPAEASIPANNVDDALQTIVAYLLSPEGAGLRKEAREAAYQARKAAYETACLEIQFQVSSIRARIRELNTSFQKALGSLPGAERIGQAQNAWQAARHQAESAEKDYQAAQEKLERAAIRADQARLLAGQGRLPTLVLASLEADHQAVERALTEAQAVYEQAQRDLQEATAARDAAQAGVQDQRHELEERFQQEKARAEAELESIDKNLKERQEEMAAGTPEVNLWKAVQAERRRREDEIARKLISRLPAQGIKKTLQEAARLGVAQNPTLLEAVTERQRRVNVLIEACREQAERLVSYPDVLPENAFALLVRGDAIRVVDSEGHELAAMFASADGTEFHTVHTRNQRRWKLDPRRDCWLVKP